MSNRHLDLSCQYNIQLV